VARTVTRRARSRPPRTGGAGERRCDLGRATVSGSRSARSGRPPERARRTRRRAGARRPTTNRPIRGTRPRPPPAGCPAASWRGHLLIGDPTPLSVMSSSTPPLGQRLADTYTWVSSGRTWSRSRRSPRPGATTVVDAWPTTKIPGLDVEDDRSYCSISEMAARSTSTSGNWLLHRLVTSWPARTSRFSELRRMRVARWSSRNRLDSRPGPARSAPASRSARAGARSATGCAGTS